jgi:hypothetical protein
MGIFSAAFTALIVLAGKPELGLYLGIVPALFVIRFGLGVVTAPPLSRLRPNDRELDPRRLPRAGARVHHGRLLARRRHLSAAVYLDAAALRLAGLLLDRRRG